VLLDCPNDDIRQGGSRALERLPPARGTASAVPRPAPSRPPSGTGTAHPQGSHRTRGSPLVGRVGPMRPSTGRLADTNVPRSEGARHDVLTRSRNPANDNDDTTVQIVQSSHTSSHPHRIGCGRGVGRVPGIESGRCVHVRVPTTQCCTAAGTAGLHDADRRAHQARAAQAATHSTR
jgi:hypothetical protein